MSDKTEKEKEFNAGFESGYKSGFEEGQKAGRWVSTNTEMPELNKLVIVPGGVAEWSGIDWISQTGTSVGRAILWNVTRWQLLPAAPDNRG